MLLLGMFWLVKPVGHGRHADFLVQGTVLWDTGYGYLHNMHCEFVIMRTVEVIEKHTGLGSNVKCLWDKYEDLSSGH